MLQNQKFFVLFTFYIGLISYHRYSLWIQKLWGNWLLIKFQSISWRTSLHHLHTRRLEELHDLQVNIGQIENFQKNHILSFFSPPATVVFILFLLFEVGNKTIWYEIFLGRNMQCILCTLNDIISGSPVCLIHVHYVWDASKIYAVNCLVRHFHNLFVIGFCNLVRWDRNWISEKGRGETKKSTESFTKFNGIHNYLLS